MLYGWSHKSREDSITCVARQTRLSYSKIAYITYNIQIYMYIIRITCELTPFENFQVIAKMKKKKSH